MTSLKTIDDMEDKENGFSLPEKMNYSTFHKTFINV